MRIRCTDDGDEDIMDSVDTIILRDDDLSTHHFEGTDMSAKKKEAKPVADAGEAKASKKAVKTETPAKAEKTKAKKELPAGFGPREIPEGYVGLQAIAEAAGRTPAGARRILRANEVAKPEGQHGWYWKEGSKDLKAVQKLLAKEEAEA